MSTVSPDAFAELAPLRLNEPLERWTTLRIGGGAEFFIEPQAPEFLGAVLTRLNEEGVPYRMLGGGANVLAPDGGVPGAVVHTGNMRRLFRDGELGLRAWAGVTNQQLVRTAADLGLTGFEKLIGVPGHVGGSLAMNAGSADWGIWDEVEEVTLWLPTGEIVAKTPAEIQPSYRNGNLRGAIVLEVLFMLQADSKAAVKTRQEDYLRRKNATQPVTVASAGCAFRNPEGDSAGRLIEAAGLKGARQGGVVVSDRHANFIVNDGGGTSADALRLIQRVQDEVAARFQVELKREIVVWPEPAEL